jgi:hypothetical protein
MAGFLFWAMPYATGFAASAPMMSLPFGTPNPAQAFQTGPAS